MPWMELSLDTTHEAVDWVRTLLATTDYVGDIQVTEYVEPHSETTSPDAIAPWAFTLCWHLPYDRRVRSRVEEIDQLLSPLHRTGLTTELEATVIEEKLDLSPSAASATHRIGQRFVIVPADVPDFTASTGEISLRLQPSLAFGSGLHPATILSLRLIERWVQPGMSALDLGCGSGILSVAMAKLGAQVLALDNDKVAVVATQDAVQRNSVSNQVTTQEGSLGKGSDLGHWMGGAIADDVPKIRPESMFDLIVANILARVHVQLAADYRSALRQTAQKPGMLITAGFTTDHEAEVVEALAQAGFAVVDSERQEAWVAFAFTQHQPS